MAQPLDKAAVAKSLLSQQAVNALASDQAAGSNGMDLG